MITVVARLEGMVSFYQLPVLRKEESPYFRVLKDKYEEYDYEEF
jgi:hypothetical protein